jgi:dihydrofolate reductase
MATIYYTASSLDGYIVDEADSLDWLTSRAIDKDGPFHYDTFIKSVGAVVMGSATYEWIVKNHPGQWMYEQPSWVLTHRPHIIADGHPVQTFTGDVTELHPKLVSAAAGKDVWVIGGGDVAAQFVSAGLIDDMIVTYVLIGRRLARAADPFGMGAGRVGRQRRLRMCSVAQGLTAVDGGQAVAADEFP